MCFVPVQYHYFPWYTDILLATGANDSSDWLHRNDSYTRSFHTSSNFAMTNTNTVKTGIMKIMISCIPCDLHFLLNCDR